MRLNIQYVQWIKRITKECFGKDARVYLFGSRVNDHKKGGDIDLYIETKETEHLFDRKLKMLSMLYRRVGEQKFDIVINNFTTSLYIYQLAREEGILL